MLGNVSFGEILIILVVTLLVFGAKRIPEIARGLGQGIREFQAAMREVSGELHGSLPPDAPPSRPRAQPTPVAQPAPAPETNASAGAPGGQS